MAERLRWYGRPVASGVELSALAQRHRERGEPIMSIVRKSNGAILASRGRIDIEQLDSASDEEIERWNAEDGVDDDALGPPRYVRHDPDVRLLRERLNLSQEAFAARFHLSLRT